jgi:hypothetical protein
MDANHALPGTSAAQTPLNRWAVTTQGGHTRMAHGSRALDSATTPARPSLFKADHPRAIDRYIDYFGGVNEARTASEDDACGDTLLERLA